MRAEVPRGSACVEELQYEAPTKIRPKSDGKLASLHPQAGFRFAGCTPMRNQT